MTRRWKRESSISSLQTMKSNRVEQFIRSNTHNKKVHFRVLVLLCCVMLSVKVTVNSNGDKLYYNFWYSLQPYQIRSDERGILSREIVTYWHEHFRKQLNGP
jgi:hypothetical protein